MFKLIGMIVGAGLIILAGIAWLDAPKAKKVSLQLHNEMDQAIDQIAEQELITPQTIKEKIPEVVQEVVEQIIEQASPPDGVISEGLLPEEVTPEEVTPEEVLAEENTPEEGKQLATVDSPWHIFWRPFHSVKSAEGFAQRLSQQTGVKISVISNEMGEHRMTFPYIDEADKQRILQLIQEKTGLEVI